ncbi:hypothetical protein [Aequorivita echinoideorum]|uniref:Lipoprotein n=1 Tax=Aequorivita echinoideorum TaxID=1549647 RepID=A0ABS5S1S7_9FLAO|nr:hypothetical protein [Aequorivita echinoideorum]MBT0607156.1 hypothetical protein [Aequorivita echinoideorum]
MDFKKKNKIYKIGNLLPYFVLIMLSFISCQNYTLEKSLENGLSDYRKTRYINEKMLDGYFIKKIAFFKKDSLNYRFIFQLSDDAEKSVIEKYGLGLVYFADKKTLKDTNGYIIHQMKPNLKNYGKHKYIIETVLPPAQYLDSIHIYLSGRNNYTGVIGNMVYIKNIDLR